MNLERAVRIWDLPTRLFHWVLATCAVFSIFSAHVGGNAMAWHFRSGYMVFTLLAFRIVWGVVGGRWSRFATFTYSPRTVLRYLRGQSAAGEHHDVGHSPLGALSVFAMLALLTAQVGSGLFADDEIANTGPLIKFVAGPTSLALTRWHKLFGQWLIVTVLLLHVGAILYYRLARHRDLVGPMLDGDKHLPATVPAASDTAGSRGLALLLFAVCAGLVAGIVALGNE
jgi:cytochrome b